MLPGQVGTEGPAVAWDTEAESLLGANHNLTSRDAEFSLVCCPALSRGIPVMVVIQI